MKKLLLTCVMILASSLSCMEKKSKTITNRLQLLPADVNNLIARYVADDFLNKEQPEFRKKVLCHNSLTSALDTDQRGSLAFHPREKKIAVVQQQPRFFAVKLLTTEDNSSETICDKMRFPINAITFNNDGSCLGVSYEKYFYPFDTKTGEDLPGIGSSSSKATYLFHSSRNNPIIGYQHSIREWNQAKGNNQHSMRCTSHKNMLFRHILHDPENSTCILTTNDNHVVSIELATQTISEPLLTFTEALTSLAAANNTIAATSKYSLMIRYNGRMSEEGDPNESYRGVAVHPNIPMVATLSGNGTVKLFDAENNVFLDTISPTSPETIAQESYSQTKIAFSPCGNMMAIAFQNTYELWYFTTVSKDWLKAFMQIPLAGVICRIYATMRKEEYKLIQESEDYDIFTKTKMPDYVREFLKHYLKI